MASPPPPENVVATVNANDSISLEWTFDSSSGGVDNYEVQISRDGASFTNPTGGPSSPTGTGPHTYGPNSDKSYNSVVGIDSSFQFRVRAVNTDGTSDWNTSPTVYTDPLPPHNPVITRPSANEITITATTQADNVVGYVIYYREDTGSGYSNWTSFDWVQGKTVKGNRWSKTFVVGETYHANYGSQSIQENARYQFKLNTHQTTPERDGWSIGSEHVYADYGNDGNVFFEDDFESGDFSAWDDTYHATNHVESGSHHNTGISGPDQGSNYWAGIGVDDTESSWLQKNLGDLSGENDVLVKCAFAVGSLDDGSENFNIEWYDGSTWRVLVEWKHEYNEQGWFEVSEIVPDSWLSTDNRIRVGDTTSSGMGGGDYFAVDRVVVSDILHEYTSPAFLPSVTNLTPSTSSDTTIDVSWSNESNNEDGFRIFYKESGTGDWTQWVDLNAETTGDTITGLTQNTSYDFYVETYNEHTTSSSSTSSAETFLNELRSAASHSAISTSSAKRVLSISESVTSSSNSMTSQNSRLIALLENASSALSGGSSRSDRSPFTRVRANGSHSNQLSSDSIRVTSLFESVGSHSNALRSRSKRVVSLLETVSSALSGGSSRSDRGPFTGVRAGSSHSRGSFTTVFNDRTSLELLDYPLEWDDGEVAWYTDWFSESKILGSEDTLAIRGMVVPGAKEPAATVYVEYDADGNGNPNAVSDPVDTGHNEAIHTVEGIPLDEGGWYRLKITNHSGYNELYSLDLGMVH